MMNDKPKPNPEILARRAERAAETRAEKRTLRRAARATEERMREREWPIYGPSFPEPSRRGERADLDPEDVEGLPDALEPTEEELLRMRAAADAAPSAFDAPVVEIDETLLARRRADRVRERERADALRGTEWTEELVDRRLEEAYRVLFRSAGGRVGPRAFGNAMPTPLRDLSDYVAQSSNRSLRKAMGRLLRGEGPPSGEEMRRRDEALAWAMTYLTDADRDLRLFVNLGAMWRAWGAKISHKCAEIGVSRQTFYRDRREAVRLIVEGLKRDGKAPL